MKSYNIAIVGPMGMVGRKITSILAERDFPINKLKLLGTEKNKGKKVTFKERTIYTEVAKKGAFKDVDIAFFCAGNEVSKDLAPIAIEEGALVIDNSSRWRMDPKIPLVVPEVNPEDLDWHQGLVANPNCSTIQMLVVLKPIHRRYGIKRVVVSTYQAVSGTGKRAIDELNSQVEDYISKNRLTNSVYPYQILFNALPHIDSFLDTGYTKEEMKMIDETKKILGKDIQVTATTVRIPVFTGHAESVNVETKLPMDIDDLTTILNYSKGIKVLDYPGENIYPIPINCAGKDHVFVGRIRKDYSIENGVNMWIVADNLRKGAALNAVQIAETLIDRDLL